MQISTFITHLFVKSEDLNHHGTLYAGRTAEWFVESGFLAAASLTHPENIVCLKIHGMTFARPVRCGEVVRFESKIVHAGRTKLVAYVDVSVNSQTVVKGFITFIHVDKQGKPLPHNLTLEPSTPEDAALQETARNLPD